MTGGSDKWTGTLTVTEKCDKGVTVTVSDVPTEGLIVQIGGFYALVGCDWLIATMEKTIYPDSPIAIFSNIYLSLELLGIKLAAIERWCFRVKNHSGQVMSYTKEPIKVPSVGCSKLSLYGWLGRPYRSRIETDPTSPAPGTMFTLKAILVKNPDEAAIENLEVVFYKKVLDTWEELGKGMTDTEGIARFMTSEVEKGTYTYKAEYDPLGQLTYPEQKTVYVSVIPKCPIMVIAYGTELVDALGPLREFRDKVLMQHTVGKVFVRFYYGKFNNWLSPLIAKSKRLKQTGLLAVRILIRAVGRVNRWLY